MWSVSCLAEGVPASFALRCCPQVLRSCELCALWSRLLAGAAAVAVCVEMQGPGSSEYRG